MSIYSKFTHRADIERLSSGVDDYGNALPATYAAHIAAQPCYWWQPQIGPGENQGERNYNIYGAQMLTPWGTDICESDRVNGVKDRRGDYLTDETFAVVSIAYKPDHLLVTLEVVK